MSTRVPPATRRPGVLHNKVPQDPNAGNEASNEAFMVLETLRFLSVQVFDKNLPVRRAAGDLCRSRGRCRDGPGDEIFPDWHRRDTTMDIKRNFRAGDVSTRLTASALARTEGADRNFWRQWSRKSRASFHLAQSEAPSPHPQSADSVAGHRCHFCLGAKSLGLLFDDPNN